MQNANSMSALSAASEGDADAAAPPEPAAASLTEPVAAAAAAGARATGEDGTTTGGAAAVSAAAVSAAVTDGTAVGDKFTVAGDKADKVTATASLADRDAASLNALQDNIKKKGQNAYYYAHGSSRETVRNYGGAPPKLDEHSPGDLPSKLKARISKYSWGDFKKSVKVYVPLDFCDGEPLPDDAIKLEWTKTSVTLRISDVKGKDYELGLDKLHDEITKVKHRRKDDDSLVLVLFKETEMSWYTLLKK